MTLLTAGDIYRFDSIINAPESHQSVDATRLGTLIRIEAMDFLGNVRVTIGHFDAPGDFVAKYQKEIRYTEVTAMIADGIWRFSQPAAS